MDQQFQLFAPESSSLQINSLFVAILPDEAASRSVSEFRNDLGEQHGPLGKLVPSGQFHVTLAFVDDYSGDIPSKVVGNVSAACEAAARVQPFVARFDHLESFRNKPGNLPLVLGGDENPELMEFQKSLMKELIYRGLPCKKNPKFNPHLTLSRGSKEVARQSIAPITWTVGEIVLVQSVIGKGKHLHLGRWKLDDGK